MTAVVLGGVAHAFSNPATERVRALNLSTPTGWEHYMRELGAALEQRTPSHQEIRAIGSRYDFRAV
jgi:hypothetical protein